MAQKPVRIDTWNQWDEFGILAGLAHWSKDGKTLEYVRYPNETNKQLRERVLTANKYHGNGTLQGMLNNISRDLSINLSGNLTTLPRYETETKKFFYLSESPYPSASGVKVYINDTEIHPQVRASGYTSMTSGWIVWNQPDFDPSLIPSGLIGSSGWYDEHKITGYSSKIQYGEYTRVLEFIGSNIPNTNDRVKIEYEIQTGVDIYGQPVLNWRSDFTGYEVDDNGQTIFNDDLFIGKKSEFPSGIIDYTSFKSGHISIFTLDQLSHPTISGVFYTTQGKPTSKLVELSKLINEEYPLYWNKFRYDIGTWDQLDEASVGSVPSFHDESIQALSGAIVKGGSKYGVDLNCIELKSVGTNARSPWYPVLVPGEFYIGNERFYLFGSMRYEKLDLVDNIGDGVYSGSLVSTTNLPMRLGNISAYSSGIFYDDIKLPHSPYFKRLHDYTNVISGVYYRTPYISYSYGFDTSKMKFNDNNFYFDYDNNIIYASGIDPIGFVLTWEHPDVYTSGIFTTYSGGYGYTKYDFNPLTDPYDKILYLK